MREPTIWKCSCPSLTCATNTTKQPIHSRRKFNRSNCLPRESCSNTIICSSTQTRPGTIKYIGFWERSSSRFHSKTQTVNLGSVSRQSRRAETRSSKKRSIRSSIQRSLSTIRIALRWRSGISSNRASTSPNEFKRVSSLNSFRGRSGKSLPCSPQTS